MGEEGCRCLKCDGSWQVGKGCAGPGRVERGQPAPSNAVNKLHAPFVFTPRSDDKQEKWGGERPGTGFASCCTRV